MADVTVKQFSDVVGIPIYRLLTQLNDAGLPQLLEHDQITVEHKLLLLKYLRAKNEESSENKSDPEKINGSSTKLVNRNSIIDNKEETKTKTKKVFLSYAWGESQHNKWVKQLAARLRTDGVESILDKWELHPGDHITEFMEKSIERADFVLLICCPNYKLKSNKRKGGLGMKEQ